MESPLRYRKIDLTPIQEAELFVSFSAEEKKTIRSWSALLQLRRRARLFSIGGRAEHFYLLLEGAVRIFRDEAGNVETARFVPGDTIGDFDFTGAVSWGYGRRTIPNGTGRRVPAVDV